MDYNEFLKQKINIAKESGFDIELPLIKFKDGTVLKPHQRDGIVWAVKGGRRALFESFGLGKTIQQLIICNEILKKECGKALIVCPLGVKQEFTTDAKNKLGISLTYVKTLKDIENATDNILITNYERVRDGEIDPKNFTVTSLDEASVLRGYGTKTYQTFLQKFKGVKYKFVCTATPSPNKYKELIHYAGYLEIMDTGQALTRFFQRDSKHANNLTIYPHKEKEFWFWISSWALFITKPSDMGYSNTGYDLPPLDIRYHEIKVNHSEAGTDRDGQVKMFRSSALGLKDAAREKRDSIDGRISKMMDIVDANPDDNFIIWHDLENERHAIKKALPEASEVYGSQDIDLREERIIQFSNGELKYLATKPEISGSGCNFQRHCHKAIFLGIGYKFNDFIQAVHRIYRFMQTEQVEIHIIYAESESEILKVLQKKWEQHNYLVEQMIKIIKDNGLNSVNIMEKLKRTIGIERIEVKGKLYTIQNNDSVIETSTMPDNSIGLIHTSIPFANHYEYTPSYNDFGHTQNNDHFWKQMDFLTPELLRILKPGRIAAIHVKDRINFGNATGLGMPTCDFFHEETAFHLRKHGFQKLGMITVVTDVVRENNQTYRLGWSEQCKDGSKMGVGCPEYILIFRKLPSDTSTAYADVPVVKTKKEYTRSQWQIDAHAFWRSSGNRFLSPKEIKDLPIDKVRLFYRAYDKENIYDNKKHVEIAEIMEESGKLPATFMAVDPVSKSDMVWDDINRMLTFNSNQTRKKQQMHICPLQFDIVERIITRYSNVGDVVYDPFAGLMTVPYMAVKLGRIGKGTELNTDYFKDGLGYMQEIESKITSPTLFEVENII